MKRIVKHNIRLCIAFFMLMSLLPTQHANAYIPDNAAATVSKWTGIANDYLSSSGLSGYMIDDLKNNLGGICYGLTLGQVIVDIAWGDYSKAWNTCQQTGIETMIGATAAGPFYAAGKLVWSALESVKDVALKSFTDKLFDEYKKVRLANVDWDKVRRKKPEDWLPQWLANGNRDFEDFWYINGDSGAINANYRNFLINKMKSDCQFTEKLITFGTCHKDLTAITFSEAQLKQWVYNNWEPNVIVEMMRRAVNERRKYLSELKDKTTFRITWSIDVEMGEPVWSTFNGYPGVKNGDAYSITLNYLQGIDALGKPKWSFGYGTAVIADMVGILPNDVMEITPPANLNLAKGTGSEVLLDMGKVFVSSSMGVLSVKNASNESVSILNLPIGNIPAKSKKQMWLPQGNYRLKTSLGIRSASITAGRKTSLTLSKPAPPPPPPPTQSSVKGIIDQMVSNIRSGRMGRTLGLEAGYSWNERRKLIELETQGVQARIRYADGTESMGDLRAWAAEYIDEKEQAFTKEADAQCNGSLIQELKRLGSETNNFEKDQGLKFGYGSNVKDATYGDLPEPGGMGWRLPPHGRIGGSKGDLIAETWAQKLIQSRTHIQEVINAKEKRISDLESWASMTRNTIESMEKKYLFLNDWSSEGECRKLEGEASSLSGFAAYQVPTQVQNLQKEIDRLEDLSRLLESDRRFLTKAIASNKDRVKQLDTDLSNLNNKCSEARNVTDSVLATIRSVKDNFNIGRFISMRLPKIDNSTGFGEVRQKWADTLWNWWDVFPEENLPKPPGGGSYLYFIQKGDPTQKYIDSTRKYIRQLADAYSRSYIVDELWSMQDRLDGPAMEDAGERVLERWEKAVSCMDQLKMRRGSPCTECPDLIGKLTELSTIWKNHKKLLTRPLPKKIKQKGKTTGPDVSKPGKPMETKKGTISVKLMIDQGINPSVVKTRILDQRGNLVMEGKGPYILKPGKYIVNTYGMYIETDPMSEHVMLTPGDKKTVKVRVWQDEEEDNDDQNTNAGTDITINNTQKNTSKTNTPEAKHSTFKFPSGTPTFDFESGNLRGWTPSGTAFNSQPTLGDNPTKRHRGQPSGHQGRYWIGTFEKRPAQSVPAGTFQGDGPKGTLTSNPFTIPSNTLSFLIGGGCDIKTQRMELIVNGKVVLKATGKCSESMHRVWWDVSLWQGRQARIRLVDDGSGGWGHINFDDLQFAPAAETAGKQPAAEKKTSGCSSDQDCPPGYVCNTATGKCTSPFDSGYSAFSDQLKDKDAGRKKIKFDSEPAKSTNINDVASDTDDAGGAGADPDTDDLDKNAFNPFDQSFENDLDLDISNFPIKDSDPDTDDDLR